MVLTVDVWMDVAWWGCVSAALASLLHPLGVFPFSVVFLAAWATASTVCIVMAFLHVSPAGKAVLITGCDSGFGFALARRLDSLGFRVFAGCLKKDGEGGKRLRASASPRLCTLQMDVTSEDEVCRAVQEVEALMPEGELLWAVVNNAGLATFGEVEWVPQHTFSKMLEVNVMGPVRVTKAFLPLIRRAKGRVVNVASMLGRRSIPNRSPYVLSKYAVEGFTDCLRQEMRPWGVSVSLIEPSNYIAATNVMTKESIREQEKAMWAAMSQRVREDYTERYFRATVDTLLNFMKSGRSDMSPVLEAMTAALTDAFPRARYMPIDAANRLKVFVNTHLPEYFYDHFCISTAPDHAAISS